MQNSFAQNSYERNLFQHRDSINQVFMNPETTILADEVHESFEGLPYYEPNPNWRVKAKFKTIRNGKEFLMPTTTERLASYKPFGKLKFKINGIKYKLMVYQNQELLKNPDYVDYLFLPFTDLTNGDETYGGGRYLDFRIEDLENNPVIDFNKSYNPYCAYNHRYSCPIPPTSNRLNVKIEAGVKAPPFKH
jgi:uncharacterized protein